MTENTLAKYYLVEKHLKDVFEDPEVTEIAINEPLGYWYEKKGVWSYQPDPDLDLGVLNSFILELATDTNKTLDSSETKNTSNLIFSTAMLDTYERIQVVKEPICPKDTVSITIRKPNKFELPLEAFDDILSKKVLENFRQGKTKLSDELRKSFESCGSYTQFLSLAVKHNKNIVIAGGTGSGKTTLMKSLIAHIPEHERLITIEDAPEIRFTKHKNVVRLFYESESTSSNKVSAQSLLRSTLRMKPDRILLTELRGAETFDFINVISSGHGGSITSIHAETVEQAFSRLLNMFTMSKNASNFSTAEALKLIKDNIDIIVCIGSNQGKRGIRDIYYKEEAEQNGINH